MKKTTKKRKTLKVLKMHSGKFNKIPTEYKMKINTNYCTAKKRERITYLSTAKYLKRLWNTTTHTLYSIEEK